MELTRQILRRWSDVIPQEDMVLLVLKGVDDMSYRGMARLVGMSPPGVRWRWRRLVDRLQVLAQVEALAETGRISDEAYSVAKLRWGAGWSQRRIARRLNWGRRRVGRLLKEAHQLTRAQKPRDRGGS